MSATADPDFTGGVEEYRRKVAQDHYRPDRIKVLFVGESPPPLNRRYFYCGRTPLLSAFKNALVEGCCSDKAFLETFKARGWFLDDLVKTPGKPNPDECRAARDCLAVRIRLHKPSVVVCFVLGIKHDVEVAALKAGVNAPVHAVPFPVPYHQLAFRKEMHLLRPMLDRLP